MTSTNTENKALDVWTKDGVKFGKELREKEFMFQKGYLNLNHGEYGLFLVLVESHTLLVFSSCSSPFHLKYDTAARAFTSQVTMS